MSGHSIQPIPIIDAYFGSMEIPIIVAEFIPEHGWVRQSYRKRISLAWARRLRGEGVTHVTLACVGREADFSLDEIISSARR
jgi:hypothetical protein